MRASQLFPVRPGESTMKRAYFLVLPNVHVLDLAGPLQIVATLNELGLAAVAIECIGPQARVRAFQGNWLAELRPLPQALVEGDVLFVIGSKLVEQTTRSPDWLAAAQWLKDVVGRAPDSVRVCGVCTGSFLLAEAGLLDGRLCTTHHGFIDRLRRQYPRAHVMDKRVLVDDGRFLTSAGVTTGIDLSLHLIAEHFGSEAALRVARENVTHIRRFGNDPQLSATLRYREHENQFIHEVQDALNENLASDAGCEALAERFGLSYRHLARLFRSETGISLKQYQLELRIDLARRLIVESNLPLERLVERCGFGSMQAFRANWNKRETLSPSNFRRQRRLERPA